MNRLPLAASHLARALPVAGLVLVGALGCSSAAPSVAPTRQAGTCTDASLAMLPDTVVAKVNGEPIVAKDLADLATEEQRMLRKYCDGVAQARQAALDNLVHERLVKAAAKKAEQSEDDWVRAAVDARVKAPTEDELKATYESLKSPEAPAFEIARPQVEAYMRDQRRKTAIRDLLEELKKTAAIETHLPDVRSPALDVDIAEHTARAGKAGAKVRVVEFADFQCPYCSVAAETMHKLRERFGDRAEFAYRHFPLRQIHPNAQRAAEFTQCAQAQGKFWELSDKLFADQHALDEESMRGKLSGLGIDAKKFDECLASGKAAAEVEQDVKKGEALGVEGTPSFYINGRPFLGDPSVEGLSAAIEAEL